MNTIRKACVQAVFDEFDDTGRQSHPIQGRGCGRPCRPLGHIAGYIDLDVTGIVDLIIDTINKEL